MHTQRLYNNSMYGWAFYGWLVPMQSPLLLGGPSPSSLCLAAVALFQPQACVRTSFTSKLLDTMPVNLQRAPTRLRRNVSPFRTFTRESRLSDYLGISAGTHGTRCGFLHGEVSFHYHLRHLRFSSA